MINTREELNYYLKIEKEFYNPPIPFLRKIKNYLLCSRKIILWKYVKSLRKLEYYYNNRHKNLVFAFMNLFYGRKCNRLGLKLGMEIEKNVFDSGLKIYHTQGIVINGDVRVGKNCIMHGANVIGNKGNDLKVPIIGDNVRLGVGAKVLGDVYVADDVQIGAGAVVLKSCYEKGALLVGIPAEIYKKKETEHE